MLLIECNKVKKYFGERLILNIDNFRVYSEDRIGIVGINGVGKTTLIDIITKNIKPDEGSVKIYDSYSYISQLREPEDKKLDEEIASKFNINAQYKDSMSGGEKTRFKLASAFSKDQELIIADEPTSNLDIEGIELIEKRLEEYKGALMIISHDRNFLDKLCNKIYELEDGKLICYNGNYSAYFDKKLRDKERAEFEYTQYTKEKTRLKHAIVDAREKSSGIKNAPSRMGNSEARLHKMGGQKAKASIDRAVKNLNKRIDHLEIKERPKVHEKIKLDISSVNELHSKIIIEGRKISKSFKDKIIFNSADFEIYKDSKVAVVGPNGCGKSTLVKMIMQGDSSIRISNSAKIGYFSQDMNILDEGLTIKENVLKESIYDETFARILLSRLLFRKDDIFKKVRVLSGGERVKVSLAKILLSDFNMLILDEPTNYMDIDSLEVIEEALRGYNGTLLFVSHDRRFIEEVADKIMTMEDNKINLFNGGYKEYIDKKSKSNTMKEVEKEKQLMLLQNRLSEVLGRLSMPSKKDNVEELDKEYYELLGKIKELKL
ncbi:ribosomal protection-like ABC-F family protein [Clostridium manihotivorum]|uniref:ABC transporter n=1 Tax=Clostridium manihotivorum TaxID=2320868 RepID=A0A410DV38_9CLOT|nr:ABC-F type ribosomal protection protein [Clostridium manihotivorum]QAA32949.1 ABC transporter [Clostridium manihotivorum]